MALNNALHRLQIKSENSNFKEKLSQHGLNHKLFHPQTIPVAEHVHVSDHVPVTDLFAFLTHSCSCTCSDFETITVPVPIPVPETGLLKQWWNQASIISVVVKRRKNYKYLKV